MDSIFYAQYSENEIILNIYKTGKYYYYKIDKKSIKNLLIIKNENVIFSSYDDIFNLVSNMNINENKVKALKEFYF